MAARLSPRRAIVALVALAGLACGLDVSGTRTIEATGGGGPHPGSGGGPVQVVDSGQPMDTGTPEAPEADSSAATTMEDAGSPDVLGLDPDASYADAGDPCDLDEDGYRAMGECGGNDCCDFDSRAHPGETSYYGTADACGSYDYDCNGTDEPEYATASCQLGFFTCSGDGFDGTPPACGVTATFDSCQFDLFFCGTSQSSQVQSCR